MPAISATAPGKVILFGEHAVVYGRPAIAVPLTQVKARAIVTANPIQPEGEIRIQAPAIGLDASLNDLPADDPLYLVVQGVLARLGLQRAPSCNIRITSTIPMAAGLGSGAATSVALIRAFSAFMGHPFPDEWVNELAYEIEKIYHGTPSGIDNTVITYSKPVYFVREQPIERFQVGQPFTILIADTGMPGKTAATVAHVRQAWQEDPARLEKVFDEIGSIAREARSAIEGGQIESLGPLMNRNQACLEALEVSSPDLDGLISAARQAGAQGAKLSGGGGGGNMIAVASEPAQEGIIEALKASGAVRVLATRIATE
jgi:mevalonate kinase